MADLADVLKSHIAEATEGSDTSLRQIALSSGVDYGSLYRFVHDQRDLRLAVAQRLCDYFDLELRPREQKRKRALKKR